MGVRLLVIAGWLGSLLVVATHPSLAVRASFGLVAGGFLIIMVGDVFDDHYDPPGGTA